MAAADSVLVPMQCEYFALEGLTALMDTIGKLATVVNEDLKIEDFCVQCMILVTAYRMKSLINSKNTSVIKSTEL